MTLGELGIVASLAMSLISLLSVVYYVGVKIATIEVKVDTMWEFTIRRGKSEAVNNGLATVNSPIRVTNEALSMLRPIEPELTKLALELSPTKSDADIALEIERRLGDEILHKVCIPNRLYLAACLFIALEFVRKVEPKPNTH